MAETKEDKRRWGLSLEAIDAGLESNDDGIALQAAVAWALVDIADSLDVVSQHFENKLTKPTKRAKPAKKGKKAKAPIGQDEEDE